MIVTLPIVDKLEIENENKYNIVDRSRKVSLYLDKNVRGETNLEN